MNKYLLLILSVVLTFAAAGMWFNNARMSHAAPPSAPEYQAFVLDPDLTGVSVDPSSGDFWAWGTDGVIARSVDGQHWQQANTPATAEIVQLAYDHQGGAVAVGREGALLYVVDGGRSWRQAEITGNGKWTLDLFDVVYLAEQQLWLAVGEDGHLLHSADGGRQWDVSRIDTTDDLLTLSLSPDGKQLLLGGENGLIGRSSDFASWQLSRAEIETPITDFHSLDELTIAASAWGHLLTSRDNGGSWQLLEVGENLYFNDVAQDPVHNSIVVTSHTGKMLRSADGGDSWNLVEVSDLAGRGYLGNVFFDANTASLIAFGHHGNVVRSTDGGSSWSREATTFNDSFNRVVFHREKAVYLGVGPRGFKAALTRNHQWQVIQPGYNYYWRQALAIGAGTALVAGSLGQMLLSEDGGESWRYLSIDYPDARTPPTYRALQMFPGGTVLAAGPTGLIMRAENSVSDWNVVHHTPFEQGEAFTHLVLDQERGAAFAIEAFGGIYFSPDQGKTWRRQAIDDARNLWHGSLLQREGQLATGLVVGQDGLVLSSEDGGENWQTVQLSDVEGLDLYGSYASGTHQGLWILGEGGAMMHSADSGSSWRGVASGVSANLRRMLEHPDTGTLIAFGEQGAITRSEDGGVSWTAVETEIQAELRQGLIEPHTGHMLIIGQDGIIIRSQDAGHSWEPIPAHTEANLRSGTFIPGSGELIVVGERIVRLVPGK